MENVQHDLHPVENGSMEILSPLETKEHTLAKLPCQSTEVLLPYFQDVAQPEEDESRAAVFSRWILRQTLHACEVEHFITNGRVQLR